MKTLQFFPVLSYDDIIDNEILWLNGFIGTTRRNENA
jgi:hypothetical protein